MITLIHDKKLEYILISMALISPIAILVVMGVGSTLLDLVNPCFSWGNGGTVVVSSSGPCTSAGGTSATFAQTILGLGVIGGGALAGAIFGILGILRARSLFLLIGSTILFAESAPLIFGGEFVFTLLSAGFFLWVVRSKNLPFMR